MMFHLSMVMCVDLYKGGGAPHSLKLEKKGKLNSWVGSSRRLSTWDIRADSPIHSILW